MTDWEQRYQDGDTPWEKGSPAPPLVELLEKKGADLFGGGRVVVPGCGSGHDVRLLAEHGVSALGVDIAESAVLKARAHLVVRAETYELGDILDRRWRNSRLGQFAGWWEHTCFCAIDPARRADYGQAAAELIEPGGVLAGVFFLTPYDPGEKEEGPPFGTTIEEVEEVLSPWFERTTGWVPEMAYPGREGREWLGIFRRFSNP